MNQNEKTTKQAYDELVKQVSPNSEVPFSLIKAFVVGGLICVLGQVLGDFAKNVIGFSPNDSSTFTSMSLIFLTALLTGLGVFDRIGKFAGAGSFVPITGFANAIVAPAMEFKREGFVMGVGAKMFVIAGPVLVYGITASVIYGIIFALIGGYVG